MASFDELTKNYKFGHIETIDYPIAYKEFIEKNYDIMSFYGILYISPGDTILWTRDFISDIRINEPIYYIIDKVEYPILDNTRLFSFLSSLNSILLRNKTNKVQEITFKRWLIKTEIKDMLITYPVKEGDVSYFYGEVHNDE